MERMGNFFAPETPPQETPAPQEAEQTDVQPTTEEAADEQAPEDDGYVDLELEGEVVRVPPKLKEGYLRNADYTRKTQELAQLQKQSLAVMQQQELIGKFQQETKAEQKALAQVQSELERYKQIDWTNLDTETYIKTKGYIDQLKDKANDLNQELSQKAASVKSEIDKSRSTAAANAYDYIGKHIKDWTANSEVEKQVASYAQNFGVPPEALAEIAVRFPGFAVMAAKASKYDSLQEGVSKSVKTAQKAPPVVKPGAVTSNANETSYKKARLALKKSGSVEDAAALFYQRMK